jgi:hypothetical protein
MKSCKMYRSATSTAFEVAGLVYLQTDKFMPWVKVDAIPDGFEHVGGCTPTSITFGTLQLTPLYLLYKGYSAMHTMDDDHVLGVLTHNFDAEVYRPPPGDASEQSDEN